MLFNEDFRQFTDMRLESLGPTLVNNPEKQRLINEHTALFNKIADLLGPENKKLLLNLDCIEGNINFICMEHSYKTGLKDGAALMQELGLFAAAGFKYDRAVGFENNDSKLVNVEQFENSAYQQSAAGKE